MKAGLLCAAGVGLVAAAAADSSLATVQVVRGPGAVPVVMEATLEAVRQGTLSARVPGRIVDMRVDAGDRVQAGEVLLRIEAAEAEAALAAARAGVAQAQALRVQAQADFRRSEQLLGQGFISPAAFDQARAGLEAADAQWRSALAAVVQAEAALGHAVVRAPFDGLVAVRHAEAGETVQPGAPLLTLYEPGAMRAVVDMPQLRVAELGVQPRARVELSAGAGASEPLRMVEASTVEVLPVADARTHTQRVRVGLPPATDGLVPGLFARVHFLAGAAERLRIPASTVLRRGELTAVYVADGHGGFTLRQLRLGPVQPDGWVEVLVGLRGGEWLAADPVVAGIQRDAGAQSR